MLLVDLAPPLPSNHRWRINEHDPPDAGSAGELDPRDGAGQVLSPVLNRLGRASIRRLYLHLDVDVVDARFAAANAFAPEGGLLPDQVAKCVSELLARFDVVAAGVASYDPAFDMQGQIGEVVICFLAAVARQRFGRK